MYLEQNRAGRGKIMLRHSVPHFPPNSGGVRVEWRNSTLSFALTPERRNENIHLNKHFIFSSGDRTYNHSRLQFVPLRHDWPLKSFIYILKQNKNFIKSHPDFYCYFTICYFNRILLIIYFIRMQFNSICK